MTEPTWPPVDVPSDRALCVALSGGPDSCALLSLVAARVPAPRVRAVHVHHHLRPSAHHDAEIARAWCARLAVPLQIAHVDGPALTRDPRGVSAAARAARYRALADAASTDDAAVLTAHTADDRLETIWMRLATGCGVTALDGPRARTTICGADVVRPLLAWWREDIEAWVAAQGHPVARDPSNEDRRRLRAVVRHDVLPALRGAVGSTAPLARSLARLAADAQTHRHLLDVCLDHVVIDHGPSRIAVSRPALAHAAPGVASAILHHALGRLGVRTDEAFVDRVVARVVPPHRAHLDGPGVAVDVDTTAVRLQATTRRRPPSARAPAAPVEVRLAVGPTGTESTTRVPGGFVSVVTGEAVDRDTGAGPTEWFDADALRGPLRVVRASADAPFVPFGRRHPRPVADVLRSDGVPSPQRQAPLVVMAGDDMLVVLGRRRSATAPITDSTRRIIGIRWTPDASLPPLAASLG